MLLSFLSGPALPKALSYHSSVSRGNDLIVIGGYSFSGGGNSASIYKLTCENGQFTWEELDVKLKIFRYLFVADVIPN